MTIVNAPPPSWWRRVLRRLGLLSSAILAASALAASGCSTPLGASTPSPNHCQALVAKAVASADAVKGAWSCVAPGLQAHLLLVVGGTPGDATLAGPGYHGLSFRGMLNDGSAVYTLAGDNGHNETWVLHVDRSGKVDDFQ